LFFPFQLATRTSHSIEAKESQAVKLLKVPGWHYQSAGERPWRSHSCAALISQMGRDFDQKPERVKSFTNKIRTNLKSDCHDGCFFTKAKKNDK
jgi:hypothetical protein